MRLDIGLDLLSPHVEQRPNQALIAPRQHPSQSSKARAPEEGKENRLCLVGPGVPPAPLVPPPPGVPLLKKAVACLPGLCLKRPVATPLSRPGPRRHRQAPRGGHPLDTEGTLSRGLPQ